MTSAKLQFDEFDLLQADLVPDGSDAGSSPLPKAALKQQVADRLAAHRSKRGRNVSPGLISLSNLDLEPRIGPECPPRAASHSGASSSARSVAPSNGRPGRSRANRIAAAVAERYAHSPTYREFLAAEAERAIAEANATAEIAARNAEAVTAVQQQLLAELDLWDNPAPFHAELEESQAVFVPHSSQPHRDEWTATKPPVVDAPPTAHPFTPGLTIRLYEDIGLRQTGSQTGYAPDPDGCEDLNDALNQLDDEIAFRHTPVFDEPSRPVPIPANLIEFPRQLVAARKSRPRIADGPLREEADTAPAAAQLRIFEVDASQFSTAPSAELETSLPEWSTIHLDATPAQAVEPQSSDYVALSNAANSAPDAASHIQTQLYVPLQVAPLSHRLMAAAVDACLLGTAFLAAVSAFGYGVKSLPSLPVAAIASATTLLVLFVIYHILFFTFACATPGMRYARIGLCTFSDDNPTRAEMRRRVWLILLAACPLGLGILWSLLDEDSLGWHDRLSRIYQRSY